MKPYKSVFVEGLEYITLCAVFYPCAIFLYYFENIYPNSDNCFQIIVEKMHAFLDFVEYVDTQLVEPLI